jgi:hypothetical protein
LPGEILAHFLRSEELLVGLGSSRVMPDLSLSHSSLHSPSSHR